MQSQIAPEYLDMYMTCPDPRGQGEGAKPLRDVLASDIGHRILPHVIKNIENTDKLVATGKFTREEAAIIAFGGALVTDENGNIAKEPPQEAVTHSYPEPTESKKKSWQKIFR